jgi:hypothetical protein
MDYQRKNKIFHLSLYFFISLAYCSHIPTPSAIGNCFSSSSSSNNHPPDQSPAGNYVYSPSINITSVTPSAQYAPMSISVG